MERLGCGLLNVRFSNRPFWVKRLQTIHHCNVDVAHGLVLLFGIGTRALPSWDSKTRRNNLFSNRPFGVKHFRLSTTAMSMSLTGSCFSSESAPGPFHHGIRRRGGTISSLIGHLVSSTSDYPPLQCRCRSRARASLRNRHQGPSIMGFEDEAEQSLRRPCRLTDSRSKQTRELTPSIVPRGTSFHCSVDPGFSPIALILSSPHAATVSLVQRNSV